MSLEDALLLGADEKELLEQVQWAENRMGTHVRLEGERRAAGITTDFERWMETGRAAD